MKWTCNECIENDELNGCVLETKYFTYPPSKCPFNCGPNPEWRAEKKCEHFFARGRCIHCLKEEEQ